MLHFTHDRTLSGPVISYRSQGESAMRFHYECTDCGAVYETEDIIYLCPSCEKGNTDPSQMKKGNLIVRYEREDLQKTGKKEDLSYFDFFPFEVPSHEAFPVGPTPLAAPFRLAEKYGFRNLSCKLDSALPSGSFKDRASQLIIGQARHYGIDSIALASTGNAGAAMSCAGAAYGVKIVLFVPESAPANKLMQSVLYGAEVVPVKGSYDDAFSLSIAYTDEFGGINRNTAYNPMTVEGKKSVSIELFLQRGRSVPRCRVCLHWRRLYLRWSSQGLQGPAYRRSHREGPAGHLCTVNSVQRDCRGLENREV